MGYEADEAAAKFFDNAKGEVAASTQEVGQGGRKGMSRGREGQEGQGVRQSLRLVQWGQVQLSLSFLVFLRCIIPDEVVPSMCQEQARVVKDVRLQLHN